MIGWPWSFHKWDTLSVPRLVVCSGLVFWPRNISPPHRPSNTENCQPCPASARPAKIKNLCSGKPSPVASHSVHRSNYTPLAEIIFTIWTKHDDVQKSTPSAALCLVMHPIYTLNQFSRYFCVITHTIAKRPRGHPKLSCRYHMALKLQVKTLIQIDLHGPSIQILNSKHGQSMCVDEKKRNTNPETPFGHLTYISGTNWELPYHGEPIVYFAPSHFCRLQGCLRRLTHTSYLVVLPLSPLGAILACWAP